MNRKLWIVVVLTIFVGMMVAPSLNATVSRKIMSATSEIAVVTDESETEQLPGLLPAVVFVTCRWRQEDAGAGERTVHFHVFGYGSHVLEMTFQNDYDGDGVWDTEGPDPPRRVEWTSLFLPYRHFSHWTEWSGYTPEYSYRKPLVTARYWIDGHWNTKSFSPGDW